MQKTLLWQVINQITDAQYHDFETFATTRYFGGSPEWQSLLQFLHTRSRKQKCPTRQECHSVVFPQQPFNPDHFRQIIFKLSETLRKWLVLQSLEENPVVMASLLAHQFEKLELNQLAQVTLQKADKTLSEVNFRDPEWYENRFQIHRQFYRNELSGARTQKLNLQNYSDELETAYLLRKLKLSCELISHSAVYRSNYDFGLLDAVLNLIKQSERLINSPEIAVYYHCCQALLNPDESTHFNSLKPYLYRISTLFPQSECRDLLLLSINYCIRNLNQGKTQYSHEGLELYKLALDQGFLFEKGEISRFTFRNAVAMGLKIGAFDWVENFILNTQNKLPKLHRDSMVSFNLARLAYEKKDYPQALEHLQKADYQDILLALAAKTLSLKIYYETQELRLLDAAIDSFKIFLRRKKVLAYHRENYQNFLKFLERLIAVNFSNMAKKNALRAAIFAEETLTEKEWFLSKLP